MLCHRKGEILFCGWICSLFALEVNFGRWFPCCCIAHYSPIKHALCPLTQVHADHFTRGRMPRWGQQDVCDVSTRDRPCLMHPLVQQLPLAAAPFPTHTPFPSAMPILTPCVIPLVNPSPWGARHPLDASVFSLNPATHA